MAAMTLENQVLARFRKALDEIYGDRLERAVLYGSRARGEAHAESDYDVAMFLYDFDDKDRDLYRLADSRQLPTSRSAQVQRSRANWRAKRSRKPSSSLLG